MTFKVKDGVSVNGVLFVDTSTNVRSLTQTITSTTNATSTNTGALQVAGGIGIGGNAFAANVYVPRQGIVGLYDSSSTYYVGFRSVSTLTTSTVYSFPSADGVAGSYLSTDGTGNLSWVDVGNPDYPDFPTGDYGEGEAYPVSNVFNDAFGVSLLPGFDCMDPVGVVLETDLGTLP